MSQEILHLTDWHTSENGLCIAIRNLSADYPLHWHDYYEMEYVVSGSGTCIINDVKYSFKANDLFFMTPSDFEEVKIDGETSLINISFDTTWISNEIYNSLSEGIVFKNYPSFFIDKISEEYNQSYTHNTHYLRYLLNCVLIDVIRQSSILKETSPDSKYSECIHKALKYIHAHFREQITQSDVAYNIGLSRNYFCSKFHTEVGISFKQFLTDLRLKYSLSLLVSSDISITDVCLLSGFNDFSNYFHVFKKKYGLSPLQYRKAHSKRDMMAFDMIQHTHHPKDANQFTKLTNRITKI